MSSHLQQYLNSSGASNLQSNYIFGANDILPARAAITHDMHSFLINAIITYGHIIRSVISENYSWAFIQSYYCIFFLAKAFAAKEDHGIVYIATKPYHVKINVGEGLHKMKGNSHEAALNLFKQTHANSLYTTTPINNENPLNWFKKKRELINYRLLPWSDPTPPKSLYPYGNRIRTWLATFMNHGGTPTYAFDDLHCYVAYPTALLNDLLDYYCYQSLKNPFISKKKLQYFNNSIRDENGPIQLIIQRLKTIAKD